MTEKLQHWIEHPEQLNKETLYELRTLLARYPFFAVARLLYLKNLYLLHDASFGDELRKAAIWIPDRKQMFDLIEGEKQSQARQSKRIKSGQTDDSACMDRTLQLIDDFLATVPEEQLSETDSGSLQSDYISYMLREEELPEAEAAKEEKPMRGQSLIDSFLEKSGENANLPLIGQPSDAESPSARKQRGTATKRYKPLDDDEFECEEPDDEEPDNEDFDNAEFDGEELDEQNSEQSLPKAYPTRPVVLEPLAKIEDEDEYPADEYPDEEDSDDEEPTESASTGDEDDGFLTETLARIYIKQQRYEKALEIIKKLSLKYPKKNTYFADQIRFLEKLIINTKSK